MAVPAAVLSVLVKADGVARTAGQVRGLHGDLDKTGSAAGRMGSDLDKHSRRGSKALGVLKTAGKAAGLGLAAGIGVGAVAVKGFVEAAKDSEVSNAKMRAQLKASGLSYGKYADTIDKVITKQSALSGLDDEDLQDSFTNIVRVTGDVNKALELNALAADFARAKNIDVAKAGELVSKVAGGNTGILSRYGIVLKDGATATEALAEMQKKFGGQAEAYGKTAAGAQERFEVAVENLQEALGEKLLPILAKVMNAVATFVNGLYTGEGAGGRFAAAIKSAFEIVGGAIGTVRSAVTGWVADNQQLFQSLQKIGAVVMDVVDNFVLPVIGRMVEGIKQGLGGVVKIIKGFVDVIAGILTLDFGRAWEGAKGIVSGALGAMLGTLRTITSPFREAAAQLGGKVVEGFKSMAAPIIAAGSWAVNRIAEGVKAVAGFAANVGGWIKNRVVDGIQAYLESLKAAGSWITNRLADGIKVITGALAAVGGWIKNRVVEMIHAQVEGLTAVGTWILNRVVDGIRTVTEALGAIGGWIKNRVVDAIRGGKAAGEVLLSAGEWILDRIIDGIKTIGKKIHNAVMWIKDKIVEKVKEVFKDAISIPLKINLPKISSPFGGSGTGDGVVGPAPNVSGTGLNAFNAIAARFGLSPGSGFRPGDDGWHGQGRARDFPGAPSQMMGFARFLAANYGSKLLELIYTPLGFGIKNGQRVPMSFFGSAVAADHYDHVHVAMAAGGHVRKAGWAMVGELGPELVRLPGGSTVFPSGTAPAGGPVVIEELRIFVGDREVTDIVRVEINQAGRRDAAAYRAGVVSS